MKEDETMPEMFNRLQVLVNDLKALGEEVKDNDFSHKFLRCLALRFGMLVTILVRSGLDTITPNQILGDVITEDACHEDKEKSEKKDEKKYEKKSVAFKATSSKSKGKNKKDESSEDEDASACEDDDEALAIFVRRFGKFMKKKGYGAKKKRDQSKNKDYTRRCYKCRSKDHLISDCPYSSDNDDDDKKKNKKDNDKKEKKMIIKKKKKKGVIHGHMG